MALDDPHPRLPADIVAVLGHPAFPAAMRDLAAAMLALTDADRGLAAMFKDGGRYVAGLCAAALRAEGLTLPAIKALSARFGMASPGRAQALLLYMRWLGYVDAKAARQGRGPAEWRLSDSFVAAWRRQLDTVLTAAVPIDPVAGRVRARLGDDRVFDRLNRVLVDQLADDVGRVPGIAPLMAVFVNRDAGSRLLWSLLTAEDADDCPPSTPVRPGLDRLALRFGVSGTHLKRMIRDARAAGLLAEAGRGEIRITADGRDQIRTLYAAQLVRLLAACRAVDAMPAADAPSPAAAGSATSR